jgi:preprotein translocase subunit SecA
MVNVITKFNRLLIKVFGSRNERTLKSYWPMVERINALEAGLKPLGDADLKAKTAEFRDRRSRGESLDDLLPEAFAVAREAAIRNLRTPSGAPMRHFDVQLIGGVVLHEGIVAEMATGEGKTLVATLPCYLNALDGKGVHVVTVNDYLAKRDRDWMSPLYEALGLTVGAIQSGMDNPERQRHYACDITYGTNNEFGFDYLRDNMKIRLEDQVQQRGRNFAIVDEVDSILIDEARTPLIISGPAHRATDKYYIANRVAKRLTRGRHFEIKEKERAAYLSTEEGIEFAQRLIGVDSFYTGANMEWPHLLEQALRAQYLFHKDVDYVVRDGEVVIVDEFTGRLMEGRTWSEGLHQAIEAKENLQIRQENQTLATITLQNYFKLYKKLSGMTGTAMTEAGEFYNIYKLDVIGIPTNKPVRREDYGDSVFRTAKEKYYAIVDEIVDIHGQGRPILVGTTSIERSELLSGMLTRRGIPHEVLNAKHHQREAEIVAGAGQSGRVTIATNMAGRGTDIVLGSGVEALGGLHVLGTERHEARRIDNQLRGRCARQGDRGSSKFYLSLEDDLMRRFAPEWVSNMLKRLGMKEGEEISHRMVTRSIEKAQKKVEIYHFEIRKNLLEYDQVMNEQRLIVYEQRQEVLKGVKLSDTIRLMAEKAIRRRVRGSIDYVPPPVRERSEADDEDGEGGEREEAEEAEEGEDERVVRRRPVPRAPEPEAYDPIADIRAWVERLYDIKIADFGIPPVDEIEQHTDAIAARVLEAYDARYQERRRDNGEEGMKLVERFVLLSLLDDKWKDHLLAMDHLRHSIGLRGYGQIDPKVAYKQEGYQMFSEMLDGLYEEISSLVLKLRVRKEDERALGTDLEGAEYRHEALNPDAQAAQAEAASGKNPSEPVKPIRNTGPKVGRNDPCPCGSGKKYKKCCGHAA